MLFLAHWIKNGVQQRYSKLRDSTTCGNGIFSGIVSGPPLWWSIDYRMLRGVSCMAPWSRESWWVRSWLCYGARMSAYCKNDPEDTADRPAPSLHIEGPQLTCQLIWPVMKRYIKPPAVLIIACRASFTLVIYMATRRTYRRGACRCRTNIFIRCVRCLYQKKVMPEGCSDCK